MRLYTKVPPIERFWAKFTRDPSTGCWLWTAQLDRKGYGKFYPVRGTAVFSHRWAYEHLVEPIPEGLEIDHLCRKPACCNPAHLEPVTHAENMRRAIGSAVDMRRATTHCPQGHEYTDENTYHYRNYRYCRQCRATRTFLRDQERRVS